MERNGSGIIEAPSGSPWGESKKEEEKKKYEIQNKYGIT
jgi:hypothetical protein